MTLLQTTSLKRGLKAQAKVRSLRLKQNLSTRRLTDLRNSIVTGLWCSKTQTKPNNLAGLWLSCFFLIDFVWQRREIALLDWLYECSWCGFFWQPMADSYGSTKQKLTLLLIPRVQPRPHKWWVSRLGNLTPQSSFKRLSPSVCHLWITGIWSLLGVRHSFFFFSAKSRVCV